MSKLDRQTIIYWILGLAFCFLTAWANAQDAFVVKDTGAETNTLHTSESDIGLTGASLAQGIWSGQWSNPTLTIPNDGLYIFGYSDFLRQSGTIRSGAIAQFAVQGGGTGVFTKQGVHGATSWGYNRYSGGADESSRHGVFVWSLSSGDVIKGIEGTQLNASDRRGDYNRTSGDARGMWAVYLKDQAYLIASVNGSDIGSGAYGNSPRPIDLGRPSALSAGSWKQVTFDLTDASSGSVITRSGSDFSIAANSKVLVNFNVQLGSSTSRKTVLFQVEKNGRSYCFFSVYTRDANSDGVTGSCLVPMITGERSETVKLFFVDQEEGTSGYVNVADATAAFVDITDQDVCILGKTDADVTNIDNTIRQMSFPTADEVTVDASFDHPSGSPTRIVNNTGEGITVLAGAVALWDRSGVTSGVRTQPGHYLYYNGTQQDYAVWSEFNRGQQGGDDCFVAGSSFGAPVNMSGDGDYIELGYQDLAQNGGSDQVILNATDGAAVLFWAVRIDDLGGGAPAGYASELDAMKDISEVDAIVVGSSSEVDGM